MEREKVIFTDKIVTKDQIKKAKFKRWVSCENGKPFGVALKTRGETFVFTNEAIELLINKLRFYQR